MLWCIVFPLEFVCFKNKDDEFFTMKENRFFFALFAAGIVLSGGHGQIEGAYGQGNIARSIDPVSLG